MTEDAKPEKFQKLCLVLYAAYAASAVMDFFEDTVALGLLLLTVAYFIGNSRRQAASGTPYASHLRWLNRTFWIGSAVIVPIAVTFAAILVLIFTDIGSITTAMTSGDPNAIIASVKNYTQTNMSKVSLLLLTMTVPTAVWWVRRCWVGYILAKAGKPVDNVTSWL